jgi:hypothetical protein
MPDTREELFSIAIFPYLKTSGPVRFGPYMFRSTDNLEGLSEVQAAAVTEVTRMLYTQNSVRSASYAVIPQVHVSGVFQIPEVLKRMHSLVAYLYGTPNDQFGDPFPWIRVRNIACAYAQVSGGSSFWAGRWRGGPGWIVCVRA